MIQGIGLMKYPNGNKYQGNFKDNLRHGYGVYTLKDESFYEGEWKNDKLDGPGSYTFKNKNQFFGSWKQNIGKGYIMRFDGRMEEGKLIEEVFTSKEVLRFPDNRIYKGPLKDGNMHGENGRLEYPNGELYVGSFINDK